MTKLECTVSSCVHYAERCCCKSGILVEGAEAKSNGDTCCGSFQVECDVMTCLYNDDHMCRAERITITGDGARAVAQTECASFRERG